MPAECVSTTEQDVDAEIARASDQSLERGDYEFVAVLRKVHRALLKHDCLLVHSVALDVAGDGYLLMGPSGIGKTTLGEHCVRKLPDTRIINGDKPLLRFFGDRIVAYGTPWNGKENHGVNDSVAIRHLVFLYQADRNETRILSREDAFYRLIHQVPFPGTAEEMPRFTGMLERLLTDCDAFTYGCVNAPSAATDLLKPAAEATDGH